ncbi:putative galacturonosyltransferase 10 [Hordeum vulgare]|nr:putative galacturonosyltransferase 10 [Hordeum vulgare]
MVRPAGLLDPTTQRRLFLDQRRPSFHRRWQQRPLWARLLLLLLLALAGSPDTSSPPHFVAPPSPAFVSEIRLRFAR